ncbi:MAG: response regulator transcription factor [Acidimicrobiia bacterium]
MGTSTAERAHREAMRLAHSCTGLLPFLHGTEEQLRRVTTFEGAACFFTIDPATLLITGHINEDLARDDQRRRAVNAGVAHNEYRETDVNKFAALAAGSSPVASLAEATNGAPQRSPRWQSLLRPFGLDGELRAAFVADGACWGAVALFRTADQPPFQAGDRKFIEGISRHVAEGIRTALVLDAVETDGKPDTPGLILLDSSGQVEDLNASAAAFLGEMIDPGTPSQDSLPKVVLAVAEQARRGEAGDSTHGAVRHRVPTRSGGWLILHGTALHRERGGSAVIIERARAPEVAPLLLAAHGLTEREQTVTLDVLRGNSTAQIAERLFISPYTVQDHLKAIFDKVGVRSRRELMAKVFFDHYFVRLQDQDPVASVEIAEEEAATASPDRCSGVDPHRG